jgi:hypothetical protein
VGERARAYSCSAYGASGRAMLSVCLYVCLGQQSRVGKMQVNPAADYKFIVPAPHTRFRKENYFSHQSINET